MLILIVLLTFTSLALGVMSLYWLFARPQGVVTARLESIDPSLTLIENNPVTTMAERGDYLTALTYVMISVIISVAAVFAGLALVRAFV